MSPLRAKCTEALSGLSRNSYSDQEVAAFCRAAYPAEMCSYMRSSLGSQPWSQERLEATCQGWQERLSPKLLDMAAERRAMSMEQLQGVLDECANKKADLSSELPMKADHSVDVDRALFLKQQQTKQVQAAYNEFFHGDDTDTQAKKKSVDGPPVAAGSIFDQISVPIVDVPRLFDARVSSGARPSTLGGMALVAFAALAATVVVTGRRHLTRGNEVDDAELVVLELVEDE